MFPEKVANSKTLATVCRKGNRNSVKEEGEDRKLLGSYVQVKVCVCVNFFIVQKYWHINCSSISSEMYRMNYWLMRREKFVVLRIYKR